MGKDHDDENRVAMRENSVILQEDNQEVYEGFDPTKPESYIMLTMFQYAFIQQSVELAQTVQNAFRNDVGRKDRGVKQQPLYVTSRTAMPAILIELGFLTNSAEEDYLMTDDGQDQMAQAIARSFAQYKVRREGGTASEPVVPPAPKPEVRLPEPAAQEVPKVEAPTQEAAPVVTESKPASEAPTNAAASDVYFTVQLSVSGIQKSTSESPFDAIRGVFFVKDGRLYRYLYGRFGSRDDAYKALQEARQKGFPDAFMVAYRGTARITLDEADQALKKQ